MSRRPELLVIINDNAARARAVWPAVRDALASAGVRFEAHRARQFGDAQAATREALRSGCRTVAVVGGDGTLGEVASGFFAPAAEGAGHEHSRQPSPVNPEAALAVLPGGTGNDFARGLAGRRAAPEDWLKRLVAHCRGEAATRPVDLLQGTVGDGARGFLCINAATLGIGAEVAGRVAAQRPLTRRLPGEARFALAATAALARWRARRVRITVDDEEPTECETNLVAVVNSPYAGGGMMFSPAARMDDGLLDVVTACRIARAGLVRELTRVHKGGHLNNPRVRLARGTRVRVEPLRAADALPVEADGDVRGHTPAELRVLAGALRVVW